MHGRTRQAPQSLHPPRWRWVPAIQRPPPAGSCPPPLPWRSTRTGLPPTRQPPPSERMHPMRRQWAAVIGHCRVAKSRWPRLQSWPTRGKAPPTRWCRSSGARWCRRTRGRAPPAAATAQTAVIDAPPLAPALKPLELIPAIVVETIATSDALVGDGPIPLTALTFDPPTPTLKPIAVASSARSGMVSSPDDDPAAGKVAHGKRRTSAA